MKILYVARHGTHDNCDEDAIGWSLEQLGHEVIRIREKAAYMELQPITEADFLLFHGWTPSEAYTRVGIPLVNWNFDLIESSDFNPEFTSNRSNRLLYLEKYCLAMFHTDGDWVLKNPAKRIWLMQGMDERVAGFGQPTLDLPPILFTGSYRHSLRRIQHVNELQERYGNKFMVFGNDGPKSRKHGRELADVFASTKIVVALDGLNTDRYWSNRVWNTLGLGGFLIHPYCKELRPMLPSLPTYNSKEALIELLDAHLNNAPGVYESVRNGAKRLGYAEVMHCHTYRHRCEQLIKLVQERL